MFGKGYILILDFQPFILFAVDRATCFLFVLWYLASEFRFCKKFRIFLPVVIFFFLRYVIELPTLQSDGKLYCMWADSKRSRRVSSVELRAAFVHVNFVHIRTFSHWIVVRRSNTQWEGRGEGYYRGFPSYGPCYYGLLAYPWGHYFCKELCGSVHLAIQSQDCYIILLLSSHYAWGGCYVSVTISRVALTEEFSR